MKRSGPLYRGQAKRDYLATTIGCPIAEAAYLARLCYVTLAMTARVQQLLQEALELQARLRLPVRVRTKRREGLKAVALELVEAWSVRPGISEHELAALCGDDVALPDELRALYQQVDGFRFAFQEMPSAEQIVQACREAREEDLEEPPYGDLADGRKFVAMQRGSLLGDAFAFAPDGSCEVWRIGEDEAVRTHPSVTAWLVEELSAHVAAMRTAVDHSAAMERRLCALDASEVRTPSEVMTYYATVVSDRYRNELTACLDGLRVDRLRALAERATASMFDQACAERLVGELFDYHPWCPWDVIAALGEVTHEFLPHTARNAPWFYKLAMSHFRQ